MKSQKKDFPVSNVRQFMETGPVVLVSSEWNGQKNIMTMGWHMVTSTSPSILVCYIWNKNLSYEMIKKSKECVINIPSVELAKETVMIGNCSGRNTNKFKKFNLTPEKSNKVSAPIIKECFANFECKLVDSSLIKKYNLFVFEVVKAHIDIIPKLKFPKTLHYRGNGLFMISGETTSKYRKLFKKEMLEE